uniref:General transcription factor IIA, 1-like n=1 Tax=Neogobius melanostomus TaxID=47308 RepID=A0A8C6UUG0_9GOBI
ISECTLHLQAKLYLSIIDDVIESMRELFLDEGIEDRVLDDLRHLWESKMMQSRAMEDFRKNNNNSSNFVLQLPASYAQPEQEIPGKKRVSFTDAGGANTVATFSLPAGLTYPVQIPAGVTLQTASGQLYKVNVPVVVTQAPTGQQPLPCPGPKAPQPQPVQVRVNTASAHAVAPSILSNPTTVALASQTKTNPVPVQEPPPPPPPQLDLDYSALSDIVQLDGAADNSEDDDVTALEENDFLGIINAEAMKALQEGDRSSDGNGFSSSSDSEAAEDELDPLNSGDDVIEQDIPDLFDTDNVIVCQYDKIHRSKNRWKFHLKDGVMTYGGRDYVFSKAVGEAEW